MSVGDLSDVNKELIHIRFINTTSSSSSELFILRMVLCQHLQGNCSNSFIPLVVCILRLLFCKY